MYVYVLRKSPRIYAMSLIENNLHFHAQSLDRVYGLLTIPDLGKRFCVHFFKLL